MKHSILITHRNRHAHLHLCLWSIERSAACCRVDPAEWEVVVADNGSRLPPFDDCRDNVRLIVDRSDMPIFCKPRLWNVAIDAARGRVLTFLDADAIVGRRWIEGIAAFDHDPALIRLCYRVRYLPKDYAARIQHARHRGRFVDGLFDRYADFNMAWEAYGRATTNRFDPTQIDRVFGNSQFSVRRRDLADLRPNEGYVGRGFEDIDFIRQFERRYSDRYRGFLDTDPAAGMFHLQHEKGKDWADPASVRANLERFRAT